MNNRYKFVIIFLLLEYIFLVELSLLARTLPGKYCAIRQNDKCCSGRQDECNVPLLGTKCYCDEFCVRSNSDCCPDFDAQCRNSNIAENFTLPPTCADSYGNKYEKGVTKKINCKQCECQASISGKLMFECEDKICLVEEEILTSVNQNFGMFGWVASNYSTFWGRSYDEGITHRLGTIHTPAEVSLTTTISQFIDEAAIPRTFDARKKWPNISRPKDQGWCGASWVFSTVSVASDRFAIMSYGNDQNFLSPQQLLSCCRHQRGCHGGHLTRAWIFIRKFGLVPETCYPWEGSTSTCRVPNIRKLNSTRCPANAAMASSGELHRVGPVYRISGEIGIMHEILSNGPVQATMKVSREFFLYKSGIFRCLKASSDERSDYHSVRIIGWGEEVRINGLVKYWIVSNSWGEWWGENGFFRIRRGVNECGIEEFVTAVWANIEDQETFINTMRKSRRQLNKNTI